LSTKAEQDQAKLDMARAEAELVKLNMVFDRGLDIDNRTIYLFGEIDENLSEHVIKSLSFLSHTEGRIIIMINSPGGSVADMFAIYDAMLACDCAITTIGIGEICSAAGLILVAGDKTLVSKNALFMAHQCLGGYHAEQPLNTAEAQIAAVRMCWDRWAECMANHTNKRRLWWKRDMPAKLSELWVWADDMLDPEYGIADGIWR
jgi:ATP-dependent Clp endopeptidase proteolytic subunit ClpP